jgi:hypothetical protein
LGSFDAKLIALRVSEDDPAPRFQGPAVIDNSRAQAYKALDLRFLIVIDRHDVEVNPVLYDFSLRHAHENQAGPPTVAGTYYPVPVARRVNFFHRITRDFAPEAGDPARVTTVEGHVENR